MLKANHVIYELEDDEEGKPQQNSKVLFHFKKPPKIDRKLGAVSYKKWGTLYNYYFSFNLVKGRLLCYKTMQSSSYDNYYSLNKGDFVKD
jgi:hypothetical protein